MAPQKRSRAMAAQEETQQDVEGTAKWSKEEKKTRRKLERLRFEPTKFASREFLQRLGLLEGFDELLTNMGLACLSRMDCPTYPEATLHFLSTLECEYEDPNIPTPTEGLIKFKIRKQAYSLSIPELCQAYGLNAAANLMEFPEFKSASKLWDLISDGDYKSNTAKIKKVRNPLLRYTLKLLANTFSGRSTTPTVTKNELCLLFQGVKHVLCNSERSDEPMEDDLGDNVNYGCILASSLLKYKAWAIKCKATSALIGGFLTPLFVQAGVPLTEFTPCAERAYMDQAYMINTDSLGTTPASGYYAYLFYNEEHEQKTCILPNPGETFANSVGNIEFLLNDEECYAPLGGVPAAPQLTQSSPESPPTDAEMPSSYDLPKMDYEPRTKAEKFLASVVEIQRKVNKWQGKMIKKLVRKVKVLQGRSSSEMTLSDEAEQVANTAPRHSTGGIQIREPEDFQAGRPPIQDRATGTKDKEVLHDTPRKSRRTGASSSSGHL